MSKGKFISFEGCDGCGKSTQASLLADFLRGKGHECVETREPGGTAEGERIRDILLDQKVKNLSGISEVLLLTAARVELTRQVIRPAIDSGKIVISDRFFDATTAYQGYGAGIDLSVIDDIRRICLKGFEPDLTIFLERDVEDGLSTCPKQDRFESRSTEFHKRVFHGYREICKAFPLRVKKIILAEKPELTHKQVCRVVQDSIGI